MRIDRPADARSRISGLHTKSTLFAAAGRLWKSAGRLSTPARSHRAPAPC